MHCTTPLEILFVAAGSNDQTRLAKKAWDGSWAFQGPLPVTWKRDGTTSSYISH
jgi:hypothetical protein